jgi:Zn finger protein HypA/HybF involved in hydrogenase expression
MHKSITPDRVMEACERRMLSLDNPGFCTECGHEQEGCEPDAHDYECEACGELKVVGSDDLLMELV